VSERDEAQYPVGRVSFGPYVAKAQISVKVSDAFPVRDILESVRRYLECVDRHGVLMCDQERESIKNSIRNLDVMNDVLTE